MSKTKKVKKSIKSSPKKTVSGYGAEQITVLEGLDPVRKRPGMYIGSTGPEGLHHLVWEVVDNSIDEAMGGYAKNIEIHLLPGNKASVTDDGRGIPTDIHKQFKVSALELVLTKLHAGGKFGDGGYKVSGGLHGVGVSVVNALSTYLKAEVRRDGQLWVQEYKLGKPLAKVKMVGNARDHGTTIIFEPDKSVFTTTEFNWDTILDHLRQQAYLTAGVRISVFDDRAADDKKSYIFYFEGGVGSYVRHLNHNKEAKHENIFYVHKDYEKTDVEIALQYTTEYKESVFSFANNIYNPEGGTHLQGFRTALTRVLNSYARKQGYLKEKDENLTGDDVREGLTAVISVKVRDPQFEGQTKSKLGNPEVRTAVEAIFNDALTIFLEEHPRDAEAIIEKSILSARARAAAKAARDTVLRKGVLDGLTLPGKLADCSSRDPKDSELFIVEGDSAGGCFSGNTKIPLMDGRELSFIELIEEQKQGKQNYCYTMSRDGHIAVAPILNVRRTKQNTKVVKVILDNGKEIICTPNHKFRLTNGNYVETISLTPALNLAPLYRQISRREKWMTIEGYELIYDGADRRWIYTHVLADNYNLKIDKYKKSAGDHRHHIDFNKRNNNPDNLVRLPKETHLSLHREMADKYLRTPEILEKLRLIRQTPEYKNKVRKTLLKMSSVLSKRAKKQWEDQEYKKYMMDKFMEFYNTNHEFKNMTRKRLIEEQRRYWGNVEHRSQQAKRIRQYFTDHPEQRKTYSEFSKKQWEDQGLLEWRKQKTREQWTPEFRIKRRQAYNQTYYQRTIAFAKQILEKFGSLEKFDFERIRARDHTILSVKTFTQRFFENDPARMRETIQNYNHKITAIIPLKKRLDVYDLEVPETHNFALAAGIFVHNSGKSGRDRERQAILPLRGKILNVERARLDKMLANNELRSLIIALGTNIGEQFDLSKLRYHKIVIMTDADVDGSHIKTLLLTFFYRYLPELITKGHIYIAQPPLYKIQKGKEINYVFNDADKEKLVTKLVEAKEAKIAKPKTAPKPPLAGEGEETAAEVMIGGINIQRYKGLGEMNPEELWETTMDPGRRTLKQVTIEDAEKTDELFDILMGAEVEPRKRFIQTHAKAVKNLDI